MIERYTRPEMAKIWEPENRFRIWLDIELLAMEAMVKKGWIPAAALARVRKRARFDVSRIHEIEKRVKHDVIAFLTSVAEHIGDDSRFLHVGMTSSDVLDTSLGVQMRQALTRLVREAEKVYEVLRKRAFEHKDTVMIGRTHGIHAEPVTFGLKMALWADEMRRNVARLKRARDVISVGKLSGAVGTFANIDPFVEEYVCRKLGLAPAPASTQVVQRDRHAEVFATLAIVGSSLDKFATEIRHLQRTEVLEVEEFFSEGQKGSSAMPHKRNPVLSENLSGLSRLLRGYSVTAMENIALWHERDISHSSAERVIAPDATIVLDFALNRFRGMMEKLLVYPDRMKRNLESTRGLIYSQRVLLALAAKGLSRERAYEVVQKSAMEAWRGQKELASLLWKDREVRALLRREEFDELFDIRYYLKSVDAIFDRVFGRKGSTA
ncbi:MAG: adenylosuccinate lyase [Deltaproteobacteria bacterium RBG_16_64_85]|nr:MAG: adenylosuccinate lyase [Deltaproteobacteria bacterium RBG_16_64_85]